MPSLSEPIIAIKSVKQPYCPTIELLQLMETFRCMVNECIKLGLENNVSTLKSMTRFCYPVLAKYDIISYYKLHAISKAAGILANRKQSLKRGFATKTPYVTRASLISSYGFKIVDGVLKVPLGDRRNSDIALNPYVRGLLNKPLLKIRSFTLTADSVSICYSKEVVEKECTDTEGIDRNLGNLTVGNEKEVVQYNLSKAADIAENTRSITRSFKRNDTRIRKKLTRKYGSRRKTE